VRILRVAGAVDEHHRRRRRIAPGADHLGREESGVNVDAIARLVGDELWIDPLEGSPFLRRRRRHLLCRRSGAIRHHEHFVRLVAVGIDEADRRVVGRNLPGIAAGHRRQLRPLAAIHRHRVQVSFTRMDLR
jgi:hypothetical protein